MSDFNSSDVKTEDYAKSLMQSLSVKHEDGKYAGAEGTVLYFTPEERRGGEVDQRTDIHKVGQVLYQMLTGVLFLDRDREINVSRNGAPKWLDNVVNKATHTDSGLRYASAVEMRKDLLNGLEGRLDLPGRGSKFMSRFGSFMKGLGDVMLQGLGYATLPFTWPILLAEESEGASLLLGAIYYGFSVPIALNLFVENPAEKRTRVVAQQQFEQAPDDLHLAYIKENKLRLRRVNNLLGEDSSYIEFNLPDFGIGGDCYSKILGISNELFFYTTMERKREGGEKRKFPQINKLDLRSGALVGLIDYSIGGNIWADGKYFQEVYAFSNKEDGVKAAVKIDNIWYELGNGELREVSRIFLPIGKETGKRIPPGNNIEFSKEISGKVQFSRVGHWWGDVELFFGTNPMIINYSPQE